MPLETTPNETDQLRSRAYEAEARLAAIDRVQQDVMKAQAFDAALAPHGLTPDAADQVKRLLASDVRLQGDERGQLQAVGPGLQPLAQFVGETLAKPEFARFRGGSSPMPAAMPFGGGPRNLGEAFIADRLATQKTGDPRLDPSQRFGLGRGPTTPIPQWRDDGRVRR
jgi:hypothetical protein